MEAILPGERSGSGEERLKGEGYLERTEDDTEDQNGDDDTLLIEENDNQDIDDELNFSP